MRDLISVVLEIDDLSYPITKDITEEFLSHADSSISLERDATSGVMTEIAYSLKFLKDDKTAYLKAGFEAFITKGRSNFQTQATEDVPSTIVNQQDYNGYPDFYDKMIANNRGEVRGNEDLKGINKNGLNNLQEKVSDILNGEEFINNKYRIFIGFAKDDTIEKIDFENYSSLEDIPTDSFFKHLILDLNWETFEEDESSYSIEASAPDLQRRIKSDGDETYDINISDLETVPFVVDKNINIPIYGDHTFPYYKIVNGEEDGVRQSIMSTTDMDDESNKWYFPSVSFGDEIEGLEDGVKNYLTFGDQTGYDVWSHIKNRPSDQYLLKNYSDRELYFTIFCKFTAKAHWRCDSNSDAASARGGVFLLKGNHNDGDVSSLANPDPLTAKLVQYWNVPPLAIASGGELWYDGNLIYQYDIDKNVWKVWKPIYVSGGKNNDYVYHVVDSVNREIYFYSISGDKGSEVATMSIYGTLTPEDYDAQATSYQILARADGVTAPERSGRYTNMDFDFDTGTNGILVSLRPMEEITLGLWMSTVDFNEDMAYGSYFYFNEDENGNNFYMRTYISNSLSAVTEDRDTTEDGKLLLKGVLPSVALKHIVENIWGFASGSVEVHNDLGDENLLYETNGEEMLYSNVGQKETIGDYTSTNNFGISPILLPVEVLNGKKDPQLHISIEDLLKWYAVSGYEYSIEGSKLIVAPREWFFNNNIFFNSATPDYEQEPFGIGGNQERRTIGYDFSSNKDPYFFTKLKGERGSCKLAVNSGMCYTNIVIGYDKEDYDVLVGTNDPVSTFNYKTGYKSDEDKELDLTTSLRMDFYGMMYWCIRTYNDDYDKQNDDCFVVDAKPINKDWKDENQVLHTSAYGFWDDVYISANIVQDNYVTPVTYYNAMRTPFMLMHFMNRRLGLIFANTLEFSKSDNFQPSNEQNAFSRIIGTLKFGNRLDPICTFTFGVTENDIVVNTTDSVDLLHSLGQSIVIGNGTIWKPNYYGQTPPLFGLGIASMKINSVNKVWCHKDVGGTNVIEEEETEISEFPNHLIRFVDDSNVVRYGFIRKYEYNFYNYKVGEVELLIAYPRVKTMVNYQ